MRAISGSARIFARTAWKASSPTRRLKSCSTCSPGECSTARWRASAGVYRKDQSIRPPGSPRFPRRWDSRGLRSALQSGSISIKKLSPWHAARLAGKYHRLCDRKLDHQRHRRILDQAYCSSHVFQLRLDRAMSPSETADADDRHALAFRIAVTAAAGFTLGHLLGWDFPFSSLPVSGSAPIGAANSRSDARPRLCAAHGGRLRRQSLFRCLDLCRPSAELDPHRGSS